MSVQRLSPATHPLQAPKSGQHGPDPRESPMQSALSYSATTSVQSCLPEQKVPTAQERFQTEELDLFLPLDQIGGGGGGGAGPRPVHLALAEAHGVDGVAADLQDQSPVHNIQQPTREDLLPFVGDLLRPWELDLLQTDGPKELLLVWHGTQLSVEKSAALRVAHSRRGPGFLPSILKLDF